MNTLPAGTPGDSYNKASQISTIAREGLGAFDRAMSSDDVMASVEVAEYIDALRTAIEPHMKKIMMLCDSPIGFRTDRSPSILESNERKGKGPRTPYSKAVIKECAIEALIRGVKLIGDQFNIISGRCYIPLNGYKSLLNTTRAYGLKYSITKVSITDSEHIAEGRAAWELDGKPYEMAKKFFCKAHGAITTWEQTEGKATRKLLKAVYERITSRAFHDDDEGIREGAIDIEAKQVTEPETKAIALGPHETKEPDRNLEKELFELMKRDGIDQFEFVKYLCESTKVNLSVLDVPALVVADPDLARSIIGSWRSSSARFLKDTKGGAA